MHRKDEDSLYRKFNEARQQEMQEFEQETKVKNFSKIIFKKFQEEWEKALIEFAKKYDQGHANKNQQDDLLRQLTIKRDRKLETINSKRKERERLQTAELVDLQAKEMLELFRQARNDRVSFF